MTALISELERFKSCDGSPKWSCGFAMCQESQQFDAIDDYINISLSGTDG